MRFPFHFIEIPGLTLHLSDFESMKLVTCLQKMSFLLDIEKFI